MFKNHRGPVSGPAHAFGPFRGPRVFLDKPNDHGEPGGSAASGETVTLELQELDERIKKLVSDVTLSNDEKLVKLREELQREIKALGQKSQVGAGLPGYSPVNENPEKSFSLARAIEGHLEKWQGDSKSFPEYEVVKEYEAHLKDTGQFAQLQRDGQQAGFGGQGGLLISTTMIPELLPALQANSVAMAAGVEVIDDISGGALVLPREKGGMLAYRRGESQTIPTSREEYDFLELRPHSLAARTFLSRSLLMQTNRRAMGYSERALGRVLGLRVDLDFFKGESGDEPTGVLNAAYPDTSVSDWSGIDYEGADQNVDDLLEDFILAPKNRNAYAGYGDFTFFSTPSGFSRLRKTKDADGRRIDIFEKRSPKVVSGVAQDDLCYGHKYAETTQLTYGTTSDDFVGFPVKAAMMGFWDTMQLFVSEHAPGAAETGDVMVRAMLFNDSAIARGEFVQRVSGWDNS